MDTQRRNALEAGILYLLLAVTAPLGLVYVPSQVFVAGDAAATAANLAASEWLVRAGIASELIHQAIQIFLVLALYRLFKPIDKTLAGLVVILGALVSVPVVFVNVLNEVAALAVVGGNFLTGFDQAQHEGLAYLFVTLHQQGIHVAAVFWGLWLFPLGLLVIRCGFIPAIFGWLLLVAGVGYLVESFVALVLPQLSPAVTRITGIMVIAEVPIIFGLLIWGTRQRAGPAAAAA